MIQFKNVSVYFKQGTSKIKAVKNVTLDIHSNEIFGIIGSSGAGKSTLLRTINLLEQPTSGEVWVGNERINDYKGETLRHFRHNIGMIFQHFNLANSRTVKDNICFPLKAAGICKEEISQRVDELLELVGLQDKKYAYPSTLSGGQKQRVGIARAIANHTKILLCDEATSALDPETTASILQLLKDINQKYGITIVLITHELEVIKEVCSRMAVMNDGIVVEQGKVLDIFSNPKDEFTKKLISKTSNFQIPENILGKSDGYIIKITYLGKEATLPVLSDTMRNYDISVNILHGKIDYIEDSPIGMLFVSLDGSVNNIQEALNFIKKNSYSVQVIKGGL